MTDKKIIEEKVTKIIESIIDDFVVQQDTKNCDLSLIGMDSLKFISIIVELEKEFEIEYPDEYLVMANMNTVHKIIEGVYSLLTNNSNDV